MKNNLGTNTKYQYVIVNIKDSLFLNFAIKNITMNMKMFNKENIRINTQINVFDLISVT